MKNHLRIFFSYSTKDKGYVTNVKNALEDYGFYVFLAHEDIKPSNKWKTCILEELKNCDVFIPIINTNFMTSEWTNQEVGIAYANNKMIVPLTYEMEPPGFIEENQAIKITTDFWSVICKIIDAIYNTLKKQSLIRNMVIDRFCKSYSFDDARNQILLLSSLSPFTKKQLEKICKCVIINNQIYQSWSARPSVVKFYKKHKPKLSNEIIVSMDKLYKEYL